MATDTVLTHQQGSRVIFSTSSHARISWWNKKRCRRKQSSTLSHVCISVQSNIPI